MTDLTRSGIRPLANDVSELMGLFSTPRPNGSAAERRVYAAMRTWLSARGVPFCEHTFRLYPWFWQGIGAWLIISRTLLALAVWLAWGWWTLPIALLGLLGGLLDVAADVPVASWFRSAPGKNLLVQLGPAQTQQEVILSAHYDTKTELLDHRQRMFFVRNLPVGIVLTILLGIIGPFQHAAALSGLPLAGPLSWIGLILSIPMLVLAWGLGGNLILGFLRPPSQGAVDNGAACAILLGLAEHYARNPAVLRQTRLTLALFGGEEINMQGSRAYLRDHPPVQGQRRPVALNLEVMAQNGEYVIWDSDGISLKLWPNSETIIEQIAEAVRRETGAAPSRVGPINSDGGSFLRAGLPAATLGTYDRNWRDRGFHSAADNIQRVVPERIPEAMRILIHFIEAYDKADSEEN
jgi:hypothetical protein